MRYVGLVGFLCIVSAACLIGCGSGGQGFGDPISGVLNVAEFRIPAGTSRLATANLTVFSTGPIEIAGTLNVNPGVRVALYADGDFTLTGAIRGVDGRAALGRGQAGGHMVIGGENVNITTGTGIEWQNPGTDVLIHTVNQTGQVTITADITTRDGVHATELGRPGGDAGDIEIGTALAISAAIADGRPQAARPASIRIAAKLTGGRGGDGFDDRSGMELGGALDVTGSGGGAGGGISGDCAGVINLTGATLTGGRGGDGGDAGAAAARNGAAPGEKGQDVFATSGPGGVGGIVVFVSPTGNVDPPDGDGGDAGVIDVRAGNGGPGGEGGLTDCVVRPGGRGRVPGRTGTVNVANGGNGGASRDALRNGGRGALVDIDPEDPQFPPRSITITGTGKGGDGFNGCSAVPITFGTHGGAGGNLITRSRPYTAVSSFRGGNAGNGIPPGVKGLGGQDDQGNRFPDGLPGVTCDLAGLGVRLAYDLVLNGQTAHHAGDLIELRRITGAFVSNQDVGCNSRHLHANGPFQVDGQGAYTDQARTACGIGLVEGQ